MASKKKRALPYMAGVGLLAVVVAAASILIPPLFQPDLRTQIAEWLQTSRENVQLNNPPAAGRYPGGMLAIGESVRVVDFSKVTDEDLVPGPVFTVNWRAGALSSANAGVAFARLGELVKSDATSRIELVLKQARTFEMAEDKLKERALRRARERKKSEDLYIITRAVEAVPTLTLQRGRNVSGEVWAELKKKAENNPDIKVAADASGSDMLSLELTTPIVVAFEVARAAYFSSSLGPEPDGVKLVPVTGAELEALSKKTSAP